MGSSFSRTHPRLVGGGVVRMVDEVGHHGCKTPVVTRVAEQVHDGHGGVTEVVHREGLEQALGIVKGVVVHRECLRASVWLFCFVSLWVSSTIHVVEFTACHMLV
eukprot:5067412-Pyramimonas_sp.AAC.1